VYCVIELYLFHAMGKEPQDWWFGISPEGFGTIAMIVNLVVALVVSRMTPAPPKEIQDLVENIRIPRGAGEAHAH
jgi:cation/acetate symporter